MEPQLIAIAPKQIWQVLNLIVPGLQSMVSRGENPGGWTAEDVLTWLVNGHYTLFLLQVPVDGVQLDDGFLIVKDVKDDLEQRLHIFILYSQTHKDVMSVFDKQLDEICRSAGCNKLTFATTRRGWDKIAPKYNFKVKEVVWERFIPTSSTQTA